MRPGKLLLPVLLLCAVAAAAADLPDAPSHIARSSDTRLLVDPVLSVADVSEFAPVMVGAERPARPRKVLDKKFFALTAIATSLTVMDYEMTQRCLARHACVESDPLLPHSRAGMYATNIPLNAALFYWSYRWKAHGRRLWWLPTAAVIASHAVGVGTNIRFLK